MSEKTFTNILTPVGRMVSGDPFNGRTKDGMGRPFTNADGSPRTDYFIALAIPKTDPAYTTEVWAKLIEAARLGHPTLFDAAGNCNRPDFSFKVVDGDSTVPNQNNKIPAEKPGYPGHWVVNFSGYSAPPVYKRNGSGKLEQVLDPNQIKRGHYIRVSGYVKANDNAQKPGVYINMNMIEWVAYGEEIITGPDANQVFSAPAAALPQGASVTPIAAAAPAMPAPAPSVQPAPAHPGIPAPVTAPAPVAAQAPITPPSPVTAPAPAPSVQPAPSFLNPQVEQSYIIDGKSYTESYLKGNGWNDQQLATLQKA